MINGSKKKKAALRYNGFREVCWVRVGDTSTIP